MRAYNKIKLMDDYLELFKQFIDEDSYIKSIYENEDFLICILDFKRYMGEGPCLPFVYYSKETKDFKLIYPQEPNNVVDDTKNSTLVYGEELFWEDEGLLDRDLDA